MRVFFWLRAFVTSAWPSKLGSYCPCARKRRNFWPEIVAGNFGRKFRPEKLAGNFDRKFWLEISAEFPPNSGRNSAEIPAEIPAEFRNLPRIFILRFFFSIAQVHTLDMARTRCFTKKMLSRIDIEIIKSILRDRMLISISKFWWGLSDICGPAGSC